MITALVDGHRDFATKGARGACPGCGDEVRAKCGEILTHHWAHRPASECDYAAAGESEWHAAWKLACPDPLRVEHTRGNHRADVISPAGYAIEFQHSAIDPAAIRARERHWRHGCWVYDGHGTDDGARLQLRVHPDRASDDYRVIRWERPRLLITHAKWPVWIDLGDGWLLSLAETRENGGWVTGSGHLIARDVFTAGIVNGWGLTPANPAPGKAWQPEAVTEGPACTHRGCVNPAQRRIDPPYGKAWYGCGLHWPGMAGTLRGSETTEVGFPQTPTGSAPPMPAPDPACETCGAELLLATPGRTTCERCRLAQERAT